MKVIDPPSNDKIVVDGITDSKTLHNALGFDFIPPCSILEEDVVCEGTKYAFEDVSMPTFLSKEDVINDCPPHEIIVETLHHEKMVVFGSQQMNLMLCQVVSYPPLKENDEYREKFL